MNNFRKKIMLVDDDKDILDLLSYNLAREEYEVHSVFNAERAIIEAQKFNPDLFVLDVMMPAIDGIQLCYNIRQMDQFHNTHILFLSVMANPETKQRAFENGGNDYLEKISQLKVLIKKINSILKDEIKIDKHTNVLKAGPITLLRSSHSVLIKEKEIELTDVEFELLYLMAQNSHTTFSHKKLIDVLWGGETYMSTADLDKFIGTIKRKVNPSIIKTTQSGFSINTIL